MPLDRRQMLNRGGVLGAGMVSASLGLLSPSAAAERLPRHHEGSPRLFPPLVDGDLLALPPGFSYQVVAVSGETTLRGGDKTPERPDGTRVVETTRGYRLIQNHEASPGSEHPVPLVKGTVYDQGALGGGCTVIDVTHSGRRNSEWVGLSGTISNCAGGATPWGSWLTCEETEATAGTTVGGSTLAQDHGYIFEVFAARPSAQLPEPIRAWGRAPHEAVVIDPTRTRVYITEDASDPNGLLYRWTAPVGTRLRSHIAQHLGPNAGRLEAMVVHAPDGGILPDLAYVTSAQLGRPFRTSWKHVPDRHARTTSLRLQFADDEITRSKKLEGAWATDQGMYFAASYATSADIPANATPHDGQLWYYDFREATLTLVAYFPYNPVLHTETPDWERALGHSLDLAFDGPDNVHVSPYGSLILAEDGSTAQHTLAWSRKYGAQAIVRNRIVLERSDEGGNVYGEMTGPCFSPDGRILFVNVQEPGHTFAIRGPWARYL